MIGAAHAKAPAQRLLHGRFRGGVAIGEEILDLGFGGATFRFAARPETLAGARVPDPVLSPADGFPELPSCRIGLVRNSHESSALAQALADHIISSLDNLSQAREAAE